MNIRHNMSGTSLYSLGIRVAIALAIGSFLLSFTSSSADIYLGAISFITFMTLLIAYKERISVPMLSGISIFIIWGFFSLILAIIYILTDHNLYIGLHYSTKGELSAIKWVLWIIAMMVGGNFILGCIGIAKGYTRGTIAIISSLLIGCAAFLMYFFSQLQL